MILHSHLNLFWATPKDNITAGSLLPGQITTRATHLYDPRYHNYLIMKSQHCKFDPSLFLNIIPYIDASEFINNTLIIVNTIAI